MFQYLNNVLVVAGVLVLVGAGISAIVFRGQTSIRVGETTFLWISPYGLLALGAVLLATAVILKLLVKWTSLGAP